MIIETYPLGNIQANCYIVYKNNSALIIDPGTSSKRIVQRLQNKNINVEAILLTHGHFDHIGGVDFFANVFSCDVYMHEKDFDFLQDPKLNASSHHTPIRVSHKVLPLTSTMSLGPFKFTIDNLAGHSNGSCFLIFDDIIFSGDILFKGAIGRYDLTGGSRNKMSASIEKIKMYDPSYTIYPGHGEATTLLLEFQNNPYFKR
ncbi:MAG: MBL fold metallo-hydrolase [Breznakia sp.]